MWAYLIPSFGLVLDIAGVSFLAYGVVSWRSTYVHDLLIPGLKRLKDAKIFAEEKSEPYMAKVWDAFVKDQEDEIRHFEVETLYLNKSLGIWGFLLVIAGFLLQLIGVWVTK